MTDFIVHLQFGFLHSLNLSVIRESAAGISEIEGTAMGSCERVGKEASFKFVVACPLLVSVYSRDSWAKRFGCDEALCVIRDFDLTEEQLRFRAC
jgi:hypothetical protein